MSRLLELLEKPVKDLTPDDANEIYTHIEYIIAEGRVEEGMNLYNVYRSAFQTSGFRKHYTRKHDFNHPIPRWGLTNEAANELKKHFTHHLSGSFIGANLVTYLRSTHFLGDEQLAKSLDVKKHIGFGHYKSFDFGGTVWQKHFVATAAYSCMNKAGCFIECGTLVGTCAEQIARYCNFEEHPKDFYLVDLFSHEEGDTHTELREHREGNLYERVVERFKNYPTIKPVKGRVPEILREIDLGDIAFAHIDMNDALPEVLALDVLWDKFVPGAIILFDDYGHIGRQDQLVFINAFLKSKGAIAFELPTGQGMVVR